MAEPLPIKPQDLVDATGVSTGFASLVVRGLKPLPRRVAIKFWRETGQKIGPIAGATDDEIATLEKFEGQAA